jgi:hypothetical protein
MSLVAIGRCVAAACVVVVASGCAMYAPAYQPSIDNVETLKKSQARPVMLGAFTVQAGAVGASAIGLRANSMTSSVGSDYAAYLAEALRQELALAGKLDPKSEIAVSGVLIKNDIAAGGASTNSGEIEARFVVKSRDQVRYEAVKRVQLSWESSFVGAIAIPKAQQQYPLLVQKLISALFEDSQFQVAIR